MLKISILKVENPSCLWGRVICGASETAEQYNQLQARMNLFYHDVTQDLQKLKPSSLEEGQVCVAYWSVMKLWCRALVESIIQDSVSWKVRCFLVDHGEQLIVPADQIRVAPQNFLQLPFWVKKFHLARVKPTTLRVSVFEEKAELKPSTQWDSSATLYLHNLLQASTQSEAVFLESEPDSTSIELYLTVRNIKICVNDDLVAKKFAYYSGVKLDEEDRFPLMLSSSILTQTVSTTLPPTVMSQDLTAPRAGDWLTPTCTPQSQQHELETCQGDQRSAGSQLKSGRFLKFKNPDSSFQPAAPCVSQNPELDDRQPKDTAAADVCTERGASKIQLTSEPVTPHEDDLLWVSSSSGSAEEEKMRRKDENLACSRLLEWLNPEPLNPNPDAAGGAVVSIDPRKSGILVHSVLPVKPCSSLDDAPITDALRWVLRKKQLSSLSAADCYSWPAVARGCNTFVVSNNADQPHSYLSPLLTHILLNSIFSSLTSRAGPMAVVLCPGWEKSQAVYDLLEECKVAQVLHPAIVLLGVNKDEAKATKIPKNCVVLVTTPFSLVRLLSCHSFMLLRLYHLVLDEADRLFTMAPDEMGTILQHFQKVCSSEENATCPQQIVAVAKRWTRHMESLLSKHMPYPCIIMTVPEEAALYGNVQQIIHMTLETNKISALLDVLDFNPDVSQKTLVVTNSGQEVEDVFKALSNKSAFCLKAHEALTHQFDFVIQQWRKVVGSGTQVVLVTTNKCLNCLGIRDATCVVHYGFPTSPRLFGSRLFCMAKNFRNLSVRVGANKDQRESHPHLSRSVLLISERNTPHVIGVLRYLRRTNASLPPELLFFAQGIHVAREDHKTDKPLCRYLKSFGVCRGTVCLDRHTVVSQLDQSALPASGVIEVVPLYIKTASVFYGRIVQKGDSSFDDMLSEMVSYYGEIKPSAREMLQGGLYAVQEGDTFHRVKMLSVPDRGDRLFFSVSVRFIDVGKEEDVKSHRILQLPERFHRLPGQAVEIILCRVQPADGETDWHPKVTRAISQKIQGLQHRARAVLSLGNTMFVDPMVQVTQVPGMKTLVNEYNVLSEILKTGMGVRNPEHLDLLKALCQEGSCDGSSSLEFRTKAEEVLAEAFRAAELRKLTEPPQLEQCEPLGPVSSLVPDLPAAEDYLISDRQVSDVKTAEQIRRKSEGAEMSVTVSLDSCLKPCENGEDQSISTNGTDSDDSTHSFHPQVRWYQTCDSVIVMVKLMNPNDQSCDFYPDRVVYRGRANGRSYRADLQLQAAIAVDCCCWKMKSNEPVLKLVKHQQAYWKKLVSNKNIFVSYDMEHFEDEDDEGEALHGQDFVEETGEENLYVNSESGSDSD